MEKTTITLSINKEIYKKFKIFAITSDKTMSELVEEFMKSQIENN